MRRLESNRGSESDSDLLHPGNTFWKVKCLRNSRNIIWWPCGKRLKTLVFACFLENTLWWIKKKSFPKGIYWNEQNIFHSNPVFIYFCCGCLQKFVKGKCFGELLRMIPKHPAKSFTDFRWDNHPGLCHDSQNLPLSIGRQSLPYTQTTLDNHGHRRGLGGPMGRSIGKKRPCWRQLDLCLGQDTCL